MEKTKITESRKFDIQELNLYYGNFQALKSISIEIPDKQVVALIGPSGCGKSTFMRVLNRMNDLIDDCRITGSVLLEGKDIYDNMDVTTLRTRVGMVFQKPNPFPMSIWQNIAYGPKMQGLKDKAMLDGIVEQSLRKAALWDEVKDKLKHSAMRLSGGQQQRLCIARAIALQPEVILMDEPASALDPIATLKIEELIEELSEEYTIVIVTHNIQQASRISDMTAFFMVDENRSGFLVEYDRTEKIFLTPSDRRTEDYITGRFG